MGRLPTGHDIFSDISSSDFDYIDKSKLISDILDRESSYQCLLLGILVSVSEWYSVSSETESGDGYCDIMLESRVPGYPNVVIELKRLRPESSDDAAERKAIDALEQIRSKRYTAGLEGPTDDYGIVFRGKRATVIRGTE